MRTQDKRKAKDKPQQSSDDAVPQPPPMPGDEFALVRPAAVWSLCVQLRMCTCWGPGVHAFAYCMQVILEAHEHP